MGVTPISSTDKTPSLLTGILKRAGQILSVFIVMALELFLGSGHFNWKAAWVFLAISLLSVAVNAFFMLRTNPETVLERAQSRGWQEWDKLISGLWAIIQYMALPIIAALDARYAWSGEIGAYWQAIGALAYAASLAFSGWAMITNAYFSTAARIQADRGQRVCQTGPYRYIRHPGYLAFIISSFATAILLGSLWALIPAAAAGVLLLTRTSFEDRMLLGELDGYLEYSHKVKYRLIPKVW